MKIGVINAMEDEHARLASHLTGAHEQSCGLYNYSITMWKAAWAATPSS